MNQRDISSRLGIMLVVIGTATAWWSLPSNAQTTSVGTAQGGQLLNGFELPMDNPFISFYKKVDTRKSNFTTVELGALLVRTARVIQGRLPGPRLSIGDCSGEGGGNIPRHRSHNSGRDVDILFFVQDGQGRAVPPEKFARFDRNGRCVEKGCHLALDLPRNWWAVRTLLASETPRVQHIFVSNPLKKLLLRYASKHGEHPTLLHRAQRVLSQPKGSAPHDDHFHVRVYCSDADRAQGCVDTGPRWSWIPTDKASAHSAAKN